MCYMCFFNFFNQILLLFDVESYLQCANRIQFLLILIIQITLLNLEPLHLSDSVRFCRLKMLGSSLQRFTVFFNPQRGEFEKQYLPKGWKFDKTSLKISIPWGSARPRHHPGNN